MNAKTKVDDINVHHVAEVPVLLYKNNFLEVLYEIRNIKIP